MLAPVALAALWLYSLTWTFSASGPAPAGASVRDLAEYERSSGQLGTTSAGEFLPAGVQTLPDAHGLDAAYAQQEVIGRLSTVPPGVVLETQSATVGSAQAVVNAADAATLTFDFFDFPGWRASVDGQPTAIRPSSPGGMITVPIAAGRHTIVVTFGATPVRTLGVGVSLLALVGVAWLSLQRIAGLARTRSLQKLQRTPPDSVLTHTDPHSRSQRGGGASARPVQALAVSAAAILLLRAVVIDGRDTVFARTRFDGERVAGAREGLDINFDDQLVLIGLDAPVLTMAADDELPVTLYWRAQTSPTAADYSTTLQVLDDDGNLWGQSDSQNPGRQPTTRWAAGQYASDTHGLRLLPGTPPGRYRLAAGVYAFGGTALSWLDENRTPQGQMAEVGMLTVTRAAWPVVALQAGVPAELLLGPVTWLGYSLNTTSPQAGDELKLAWFWRAEGASRPDLSLHLALRGADGAVLQSWDNPLAGDYPSSAWAAGEVVRGVTVLRVPAAAPAGPAQLEFSLRLATDPAGPDIAPAKQAAALDVRVPERAFEIPPLQDRVDAELGGLVRLLGFETGPGTSQMRLYWLALQPMDTSYQVFVHVLGADGAILAQADAAPVGGSRPTTGWLPGEVLADPYALPLNGAAALEVGMVDPATGQRLGVVKIDLP